MPTGPRPHVPRVCQEEGACTLVGSPHLSQWPGCLSAPRDAFSLGTAQEANHCHPAVPTDVEGCRLCLGGASQAGPLPPGRGPLGEQGGLSCRWACGARNSASHSVALAPQGTCFLRAGLRNPGAQPPSSLSRALQHSAGQARQSALARFESAWGAFDPRGKKKKKRYLLSETVCSRF